MSLSIFDIYNKEGVNYKQFFYNTSDFFIDKNGILHNCKTKSGSLILRNSNQNKLRCHTEDHQSFIKTIIPEKEFNFENARLSKYAGICIRNLLLITIIELGKSFNVRNEKVIKPLSYMYKENITERKFFNSSNYKDIEESEKQAYNLLKEGLITKIPFLKNILEERLEKLLKWKNYNIKDYKKPYELLYTIHSILNKEDKPVLSYKEKDTLIKIEDILFKTSITNMSLKEYQEILSKCYENNIKVLKRNKYKSTEFSILCKWDYIKKFSTHKSETLKEFNLLYCNKRKNVYAPLDKSILEQNKILAFTCKNLCEFKSFKVNLNLDIDYIYYDKIEKEFIFFLEYTNEPYPGYLRLISNALKELKLKTFNCEGLFNETKYGKSIAFLLNNDVQLLNVKKNFQPEENSKFLVTNFNGEDIDTGEKNNNLEWLLNPYNKEKPKIFKQVEIPFIYYNKSLEGNNSFYKKSKKFRVNIDDLGNIEYQESKEVKNIIFNTYEFNTVKGFGYLVRLKTNLLKDINKRLTKAGKRKLYLEDKVLEDIFEIYIGNVILYLLQKTKYNYNVFKKDTNELRSSFQELCIESNVRYKLFNKSVEQYLKYMELNNFKDEEDLFNSIKTLASYEVFLHIYKAICEDLFQLTPVELPIEKKSISGICLSYKFNLSKMIDKLNKIHKRISIKLFFEQDKRKLNDWETKLLDKISYEDKEIYKEVINTHNYQVLQEKTLLVLRNIYKVNIQFIFNVMKDSLKNSMAFLKNLADEYKTPFKDYIINTYGLDKYKPYENYLDYLELV